ASKVLGVGELRSFFKLILPLARPAVIAGLILVLMEVLNDYGAAQYYGVNTFTTGIFRSWFSLEEPETAIYLSAILIVMVFGLLLIEKWQRRRKQFVNIKNGAKNIHRKAVSKKMQFLFLAIVSIPVVLGFFIPLLQLVYWAYLTFHKVFDNSFIILSLQSFGIAFLTALLTVIIATLLIFSTKWNKLQLIKSASKMGIL